MIPERPHIKPSPPHPASVDPKQLLRVCEVTFSRSSGPGGQHRNRTQTAVELHHKPTGVTAAASERRSQAENRAVALHRLRVTLALSVRCPFEGQQPPSDLWQSRRKGRTLAVNPEHADFPALLAEAMDAVVGLDFDVSAAAEHLGISTSQLVRLLGREPRALAWVNQCRSQRGLGPLR
jgi:hypothetical protein